MFRFIKAGAVAGFALIVAAGPAFANNSTPNGPTPPSVSPTTIHRTTSTTDPLPVVHPAAQTATQQAAQPAQPAQVLAANQTRDQLPFTGGDVAGLAAIGGALVAGGVALRWRSRQVRTNQH